MKNNRRGIVFPVVSLILAGSPLDLPAESATGETEERYIIQKGDTLWDIAADKIGDPFRWPELWKANPYITNPDLIYPGNPLILKEMPVAEPAQAGPLPSAEGTEAPPLPQVSREEGIETEPTPAPLAPEGEMGARLVSPPAARKPLTWMGVEKIPGGISASAIASGGAIVREIIPSGFVDGSPEEKTLFGEGDRIFIRLKKITDLTPGETYTLYRTLRPVKHPETGLVVGDLIQVLGTVKIEMTEGKKGVGLILDSYDYITAGDRLLSVRGREEIVTALPAPDRIEGVLLDSRDERSIIGQYDVVYLDKGGAHGLAPGLRFTVTRKGETAGEVQVLSIQKETSTLLVNRSSVILEPGDELVLQKP